MRKSTPQNYYVRHVFLNLFSPHPISLHPSPKCISRMCLQLQSLTQYGLQEISSSSPPTMAQQKTHGSYYWRTGYHYMKMDPQHQLTSYPTKTIIMRRDHILLNRKVMLCDPSWCPRVFLTQQPCFRQIGKKANERLHKAETAAGQQRSFINGFLLIWR